MPDLTGIVWRHVLTIAAALWVVVTLVRRMAPRGVSASRQRAPTDRDASPDTGAPAAKPRLTTDLVTIGVCLVIVTAIAKIQATLAVDSVLGAVVVGGVLVCIPIVVLALSKNRNARLASALPRLVALAPLIVVSSVSLFLLRA